MYKQNGAIFQFTQKNSEKEKKSETPAKKYLALSYLFETTNENFDIDKKIEITVHLFIKKSESLCHCSVASKKLHMKENQSAKSLHWQCFL